MSAKDAIHVAVKNALVKDGWIITADPYTIQYKDAELYADLGAERPVGAERAGRIIVVEIKSFLGPSPMYELEQALGQYELYRGFLEVTAPTYDLYLAVSSIAYRDVFERESVQLIVKRYQVALIVVQIDTEEIIKWIDWSKSEL